MNNLKDFSSSYKIITNKNIKNNEIEYFNIKRNQQIRSLLAAIENVHKKALISDEVKCKSIKNLRNFFFIFNTCNYTSNKTDSVIKNAAYDVYRAETEIDFKFIITRLYFELSKLMKSDDIKKRIFSNQSLTYSNKDKTLKRNRKLVKYILVNIYNSIQNDTELIPDKLTIEHLYSDNGSIENSCLANLTLTSSEINCSALKNKKILEKVEILEDLSSIKYNKNLKYYCSNGKLDLEKRKKDLANQLIDITFKFEKELFKITKEKYEEYFKLKKILKEEKDLYSLLINSGINFKKRLKLSKKNSCLLNRFNEITNNDVNIKMF